MKKRTKLFWITPKWPLPAEDGARQATYHLVRNLAHSGAQVHLVAIVPRGEKTDLDQARRAFGVEQVSTVSREPSRHFVNLLARPWQPVTIAPYMSPRMAREIRALHAEWDPDSVVVFDGLHSAGWYLRLPAAARARMRVIHRAHNVESNLWTLGATQRRFPYSSFLRYQARRVAAFEKKVCHASRLVAAVSEEDERGLKQLYGGGLRTTATPIGVPLAGDRHEGSFPSDKNLLFVGRLDWDPNRDGLRWFLENVWPEAVRHAPDLRLVIAGTGDGSWLRPYLDLPNLLFLGRVPDLAPHYRAACASLVPIFFGSGTRVKAIEAASYARPCISTAIGVEGIGFDPASSYFRAETREQWVDALCALSLDEARRRGEAAYERISFAFDPAKVATRFIEKLEASL